MFKSFSHRALAAFSVTFTLSMGHFTASAAKIEVYDIPKESPAGHVHGGPNDSHGHGGAAAADPHGGMSMAQPTIKVAKLPAGWTENPNPGSMRAASYLVKNSEGGEAEVAVIPMPGMANIELQLVNMWREQAKLPAVTEAELSGHSVPVTIGTEQGKLFEVASADPVIGGKHKARILVAMLKRAETMWFFKFAGEDGLVATNKAPFIGFLKDVSFEAPAMPAGHPPIAGGGASMSMGQGMMGGGATVPPGTGEHPEWKVPKGWTEVARSTFLVAKFQVTGEGTAKADINVSMSPGDGGGLLPNVNRWRAQLNLSPLDVHGLEKIVESIQAAGANATLVDFSGAGAENGDPQRCVGIMVSRSGEAWFFKLMGSTSVVAREKQALIDFVRSVKF
jgi:hypothetical protein